MESIGAALDVSVSGFGGEITLFNARIYHMAAEVCQMGWVRIFWVVGEGG